MSTIDVEKLIEWLGPDGAIAGLKDSDLKVSELCELAVRYSISVEKNMRRSDVINELINRQFIKIDKTTEELLAMNYQNLRRYLKDKKVSRTELLNLLSQLDMHPGSEAKRNLVDFVAREVSDLGMYGRVAKGKREG